MSFKQEKVKAAMILDIIGRPPEHLVETLNKITKEIENEKGVVVKMKSVKEPTLMKNYKDFYTTFAEIELETDGILYLIVLMFKYMPAHIEIIEPETISLDAANWNDVLNELVRRLHAYDEIARVAQIENVKLAEQVKSLTGKDVQEKSLVVKEKGDKKENNKKIKKRKSKT